MSLSTGTGRYCRSSKYHDKAVDVLHATGNGFIVTASQGSKFVKIWRVERKDREARHEISSPLEYHIQIFPSSLHFLASFCLHAQ